PQSVAANPSSKPRSRTSRASTKPKTSDHFLGQLPVGLGAGARSVVLKNRLTRTRRLAQTHRSRNRGIENLIAQMPPHLVHDLARQIRPNIEHRHHDPAKL